jgi:cell division septation protein DedD
LTDATHDLGTVDDGFHEIHLSGKQLVFLFMATTVVSVVIFLLGVMVGRGVPAQRQASDPLTDPSAAASVAPAPSPAAADAGPAAAEPPAPPAESDELSYKKRLEGDASAAESLKPRVSQPEPRPAPPAAAPGPAAQSTAQSTAQSLAGTPQPGTWIVQVHALRDRTVASGIVQRLAAKGYPAFLVAAGPPTGSYKVQVGRFKNRDEAQRVVERLTKEEQFNPWITR